MFAALKLDDRAHVLTATSPALDGSWSAQAAPLAELHCAPHGPIGCGENATGSVNANQPTSQWFATGYGGPNPWVVFLRVPPTVSGSVDLAVPPYA